MLNTVSRIRKQRQIDNKQAIPAGTNAATDDPMSSDDDATEVLHLSCLMFEICFVADIKRQRQ